MREVFGVRLMHLADLHIGKKVNGFSMLEDQRFVLKQVLKIASEQSLDGVILAGDIYDKAVPAGEAVQLLDWFLTELAELRLPVYMVSGNHDSADRLSFGAKLIEKSGVYVAGVYDGTLEPIVLEDEYGTLNLYLLPFVKPVHVRRAMRKVVEELDTLNTAKTNSNESMTEKGFFGETDADTVLEDEIKTYDDAMAKVLEIAEIHADERNLLVAHQLVTGAARCDSEDVSVGGIDNVSAELFEDFDYVALGHIHGPQSMTKDTIRYAGTLLKYSFSECNHKKSITIVELREKGDVSIETIPVEVLHDMRILKGEYASLMAGDSYDNVNRKDYIKVVLTDEQEIPEVMGKMRTVYPNIMMLEYDNKRTRTIMDIRGAEVVVQKQPMEYFKDFYEKQNGVVINEEQERTLLGLIKEIWGD